ncbi:hypothetical protein ABNT98_15510 [Klebsiella pneumoniae]
MKSALISPLLAGLLVTAQPAAQAGGGGGGTKSHPIKMSPSGWASIQ